MPQLFYSHDPMCSFCWAFRPAWAEIIEQLPGYEIVSLVGGLAPDSDEPMPERLQEKLQATWRAIQKRIPGTPFNFDFWERCYPRRSTYPSCRAVIAAQLIDPDKGDEMIFGIQTAYYLRAENPSDEQTLARVAERIGLDRNQFTEQLHAETTKKQFQYELAQTRALGITSFPSVIWVEGDRRYFIPIEYNSAQSMLELIKQIEASTPSS